MIGSGQTGVQLAEEFHRAGRETFLACGRAPWGPRRLGDKNSVTWLRAPRSSTRPWAHCPARPRASAPTLRRAALVVATTCTTESCRTSASSWLDGSTVCPGERCTLLTISPARWLSGTPSTQICAICSSRTSVTPYLRCRTRPPSTVNAGRAYQHRAPTLTLTCGSPCPVS